jgi:hypothetical protein
MTKSSELQNDIEKLRGTERLSRCTGCVGIAGGVVLGVIIGSNVAHGGLNVINYVPAIADVLFTAMGIGALSLVSSVSRRADALDAELLRRDNKAEALLGSPGYIQP